MSTWEKVPGYWVEVTRGGKARSMQRVVIRKNGLRYTAKGKQLKPSPKSRSPRGKHLVVRASRIDNGVSELAALHRLVLLAFVGPCPQGMECRHLDDDPTNNNLENLCWGTRKEQAQDRKRNNNSHYKVAPKGIQQWLAKLTDDKVSEIRQKYEAGGVSIKDLATQFGVSVPTIFEIIHRKIWKHVG